MSESLNDNQQAAGESGRAQTRKVTQLRRHLTSFMPYLLALISIVMLLATWLAVM